MQSWFVVAIAAAYVALLFLVAWWGERARPISAPWMAGLVYCLTLAVYNTAWSFYGSVGRATHGFDFLPIYIGPILVLVFGQPVLRKIIVLAKTHNATSIADFIAIRYGRSQPMAALVTVIALVAVLPYIALQLKAVAASFDVLTAAEVGGGRADLPFWQDSALAVAVAMAAFAIIFGVRHVHASEHHRGLMLAIAFESLVKLSAFIIIGAYVVWGILGGPGAALSLATSEPAFARLLEVDLTHPTWASNTLISIFAFLCVPHMFHVAVVENERLQDTRRAAWLFPAYLTVFSLFMLPIALSGLATFGGSVNPDTFVVSLPLARGSTGVALLAFIGGLSAATGMVIVAAVALSTMVCNDVAVPLLLRSGMIDQGRFGGDISRSLIMIRRVTVVAILLLAYAMHQTIDQRYPLTSIGLLSFVAIAQFGPSLIGGLYWRGADRSGAVAGIVAGVALWAYTLLIPSAAALSSGASDFVSQGLFGAEWLKPQALFGLTRLDPISHATFWSLSVNTLIFLGVSLLRRQNLGARVQAHAFLSAGQAQPLRAGRAVLRIDDLKMLAARFVGAERAATAFETHLAGREPAAGAVRSGDFVDAGAVRFTENLLAGAIGAASARIVIAASLEGPTLTRSAAMAMLDEASEVLQFNRKLLEGALESVPQGILVFDAELLITAWNPRLVTLLDLPQDFLRVGLPFAELVAYNQRRGEYRADDLKALLLNRDIVSQQWPYAYERKRPDGSVLEVVNDRMPEGGYISTYTDVTERHRAAEALRAARDTLEQRVQERTEALELAKADAERANLDKTRFLASASHDLLQPLNAARLFLAALQEAAGRPERPDATRALVDNASAALRSTEHLLNTLLDISSLDSGATRVTQSVFPISELFGQLDLEFSALAKSRSLGFKVLSCGLYVRSDPHLLRRVLQNLLANAVRYTSSGRVLLAARARGAHLRIEVWDMGVGIPEDRQEEIFQEFRRLDARAGEDVGHGLGLAIVRRIAGRLQHPVGLCSRPGRGSLFHISAPIAEPPAAVLQPAEGEREAEVAARPALVLCVDNDAAIREGMTALLERWDYRVVTAADGDGAVDALGDDAPDVVLLDYHLDGAETGLDLLDRLRARWGRGFRALIVTADRGEEIARAARERGAPILSKPIKPAALRRFLIGAQLRRLDAVDGETTP